MNVDRTIGFKRFAAVVKGTTLGSMDAAFTPWNQQRFSATPVAANCIHILPTARNMASIFHLQITRKKE